MTLTENTQARPLRPEVPGAVPSNGAAPRPGNAPRPSGRGSNGTSQAGSNGAAPPKPQRPALSRAPEPDQQPTRGLAVFVGAMIALAVVKEILRRIGDNPVSVKVRDVSRDDKALSIAVVVRTLERMGASVLGSRGR